MSIRCSIRTILASALTLAVASPALGQTATVTLTAQKQYIRGFGGMVHIPWAGDLTAAERTLAFGNADGQLGFTILRIAVPDGSTSVSSYVATAKAAIAAGGIVFASPWNSSGNMNSSDFATYADHLASFVSYMKSQGTELYAISVQNEPDYATQSGWRAWTAAQCHDFVLNYGDKVGTKLMSCESFNYTKSLYDPILNDSAALDKLGVLGAHLYGTSVNNFPYPLFDQKAAGKVERWMTEHYTDSNTDANSWPNALGVATELHNSMVKAQFNAYTWWYIKRSYGPINNGVTKRGWCMAHWSKFVRPGYYRVDATETPTSGVSLSAFKGEKDVVIVAVNTNTSSKAITVTVSGTDITSYDKFTTSSGKSLANDGPVTASGGSLSVTLDAQSVTTLHGSGTVPASGTGGASGSGGTTGSGGATGSGGSTGIADAGRDVGASGGTGGTSAADAGRDIGASGGSGGSSATDAGADIRGSGGIASGGTTGTGGGQAGSGGAVASGGVSNSGGSATGGSGGQVGSGGSGGAVGSGGAPGSGGTSVVVTGTDTGCACALTRPNRGGGTPLVLAGLLSLAVGFARRRRV